MNKITFTLIIAFFCLIVFEGFSQNDFATIEKNRNFKAKDLLHELSPSKDTLILSSNEKLGYVYSINRKYRREVDTYFNSNSCKIPLANLSQGKHLFVVNQGKYKIVFAVRVHGEQVSVVASSND
jgi:hypothetical protein